MGSISTIDSMESVGINCADHFSKEKHGQIAYTVRMALGAFIRCPPLSRHGFENDPNGSFLYAA